MRQRWRCALVRSVLYILFNTRSRCAIAQPSPSHQPRSRFEISFVRSFARGIRKLSRPEFKQLQLNSEGACTDGRTFFLALTKSSWRLLHAAAVWSPARQNCSEKKRDSVSRNGDNLFSLNRLPTPIAAKQHRTSREAKPSTGRPAAANLALPVCYNLVLFNCPDLTGSSGVKMSQIRRERERERGRR